MQDLNFFSSYIAAERSYRKKFIAAALAFTGLLLIIGVFTAATELTAYFIKRDIKQAQVYLNSAETQEQLRQVKERKKELDILTKYSAAVENAGLSIDASDIIKSSLLETINTALPRNLHMQSMAFSDMTVTAQGISQAWIPVAELEHNLNALGIFEKVHVSSISGDVDNYAFSIECMLKGKEAAEK